MIGFEGQERYDLHWGVAPLAPREEDGSEMETEGEPRASASRRISLLLRLTWDEGEIFAYTRYVSLSGLFVETEHPIPLDSTLRLEGEIAGDLRRQAVAAQGRVVEVVSPEDLTRDRPVPGVSIELDEIFQGESDLLGAVERPADTPPPTADGAAGEERRSAPRFCVGVPVRWGEAWPPGHSGYMSNVSASGALLLAADAPLPVGTRLGLSFELPDGGELVTVRAEALVVRIAGGRDAGGYGLGIAFDRSRQPASALTDFLLDRIEDSSGSRDLPSEEYVQGPEDSGDAADGPPPLADAVDVDEPPAPGAPDTEEPQSAASPTPGTMRAAPPAGTPMSARKPGTPAEDPPSDLLGTLSDTLSGTLSGGGIRVRWLTKVLMLGMLAAFMLWMVKYCFSGGS